MYAMLFMGDQVKIRETEDNSVAQHKLLYREIQNDYTKGSNCYPHHRITYLEFLDWYSKNHAPVPSSEGKEYCKAKECFKCHKMGHPKSHCPPSNDSDAASLSSKDSMKEIKKKIKQVKKLFAQLQTANEDDELLGDEQSCFQYSNFSFL